MGVKGKVKGQQVGWKWETGFIRFIMSSQLWFRFHISEIKDYLITEISIDTTKLPTISYTDLLTILKKMSH